MNKPSFLQKKNPHIFEINTWLFIRYQSHKYGRALTLGSVPLDEWKAIAEQGFDFIWLMGVWQRSPQARQRALEAHDLRDAYAVALPDWKQADVPGSPYAIYAYHVDSHLGADEELLAVKERLNAMGLGLLLDFVPNHLAIDHPRTISCPDMFIPHGSGAEAEKSGLFFKTPQGTYLAHGRDPYFSPWRDTVQVNFSSPLARKTAISDLRHIATHADGVRCDMAMLALTHVFQETWGAFLGDLPEPREEFWYEVIQELTKTNPDFLFLAEAYWDLEWNLQQVGFHYTYDKILYDRLCHSHAWDITAHLKADLPYQQKSVRFIENHDEKRALEAFGLEKSKAAAMAIMTLPGSRLIHDGQIEGKSVHLPVQLGRAPKEQRISELETFYQRLFQFSHHPLLHEGSWELLHPVAAWDGNQTHQHILAWQWELNKERRLILINYSEAPAQARVLLSLPETASLLLHDFLTGKQYERDVEQTKRLGLYVALEPWQAHLFEFTIEKKTSLK